MSEVFVVQLSVETVSSVELILNWIVEFQPLAKGEEIPSPRDPLEILNLKDGNTKVQRLGFGYFPVLTDRIAIKHFVESRYKDLLKNHNQEEADARVQFLVKNMPETLLDPMKIEDNSTKTENSFRLIRLYDPHAMAVVLEVTPKPPRKNIGTIHFVTETEYQRIVDICP